MAQLLIKKENGEEILIRDNLPENVIPNDFFYKEDYIGMKLWTSTDVYTECIDMGECFPSVKLIERASNILKKNECLNDCSDSDWDIIRQVLKDIKTDCPVSVKDFAEPGEYIYQLILEGEYIERYIISEDKELKDLGGCLEYTLNRILDIGVNEYNLSEEQVDEFIYSIMGASKSEENPIWIDKGYTLPNILSCKVIADE